jgi:hypothetical protein
MEACPKCGGLLVMSRPVVDPHEIELALASRGLLPPAPPLESPSRGPRIPVRSPQMELHLNVDVTTSTAGLAHRRNKRIGVGPGSDRGGREGRWLRLGVLQSVRDRGLGRRDWMACWLHRRTSAAQHGGRGAGEVRLGERGRAILSGDWQ